MDIHAVIEALLHSTSSLASSFMPSVITGDTVSNNRADSRNMALQEKFTQLLHLSNKQQENALTLIPASDPQYYINRQENLAINTVKFDLIAKTAGSITQSINKLANMQ